MIERFPEQRAEIAPLFLCIMLNNKEIFRYLWGKMSYMWNDVHFILLAQYIFESEWIDGIKILFADSHSHAIFNMMNLQEKEKFLKYSDAAASKIPSLIKEFRYKMSFDPYHIYYLPIIAQVNDL